MTLFFLYGSSHAGTWIDEFDDDNLDGWTIVESSGGTSNWQVKDGVLDVTIKNEPRVALSTHILELTAFPIEEERFRVIYTVHPSSPLPTFFGILLGRRFEWNRNLSLLRTCYQFYLRRIDGPIAFPDKSPNIQLEIRQIDVHFDRGHFELFSEGEQIAKFEDNNFQQITVVALIARGDDMFHVVVDSFEISGPGIHPYGVHTKGKVAVAWGGLKRP